jgi:pimeloyl-ACP methyl ester carboxylesterase
MSRSLRSSALLVALALLAGTLPIPLLAAGQPSPDGQTAIEAVTQGLFSVCAPDQEQPSGSVYRFCQPPSWWHHNGSLVIFAHGYVDVTQPIAIPEDQLCPEPNFCIPDVVNFLGFDFATTSYPVNGLAIVPGIADLLQLVDVYAEEYGTPERILLVGASEGGLVTTLSVEDYADSYDGGLSACGPIGSFRGQVDYLGDSRVVLDYFFPGLIPGSPIDIPPDLLETWDEFYPDVIYPVLFDPANESELLQFINVASLPFDPQDFQTTVENSVYEVLWYNVFATNNAAEVLGGQPFGNETRWYHGSLDDEALNAGVERFAADPEALEEIATNYRTTGDLAIPLVTIQTTLDPVVPFWQDQIFQLKTIVAGSWPEYHFRYPPVDAYGHCAFPVKDLLAAFLKLIRMTGGQVDATQVQQLLTAFGPDTIVHLDP